MGTFPLFIQCHVKSTSHRSGPQIPQQRFLRRLL
jgi:hypothetical protein